MSPKKFIIYEFSLVKHLDSLLPLIKEMIDIKLIDEVFFLNKKIYQLTVIEIENLKNSISIYLASYLNYDFDDDSSDEEVPHIKNGLE